MMDAFDPDSSTNAHATNFPNTIKRRRTSMAQSDATAASTSGAAIATPTSSSVDPDLAEYPNTVKRRRTSMGPSDETLAGPATAVQFKGTGNESVAGDVDTCRICRGEGTPNEPLFYPCKCSGSIKYVHQDCLMEWLSHSQKKHCELCKTPFRFTKLYSPDMPKRLPLLVFVRHMARYFLRSLGNWLRAALVISVWLGWLPYLMRSVWTFLFWVSDEGFGLGPSFQDRSNFTQVSLAMMADTVAVQGFATTTCPSSPLFPVSTTAASRRGVAEGMPSILKALGYPLINVTGRYSLVGGLMSLILPSAESVVQPVNATSTTRGIAPVETLAHSSLLSEVSFLKNLTPHIVINRTVISILEGQIITILVILCFILIILVRDYVVQQQPEINMRAAFAAQQLAAQPQENQAENQALNRGPFDDDDVISDNEDIEPQLGLPADDNDSVTAHYDRLDDIHGRFGEPGDELEEELDHDELAQQLRDLERRAERREMHHQFHGRHAQHVPSEDSSQSTVNQYLRIFREAGGDPDRILQIIHDEGLDERLAYWVRATQTMTEQKAKEREVTGMEATESDSTSRGPRGSPSTSQMPEQSQERETEQDRKGKGRATDSHDDYSNQAAEGAGWMGRGEEVQQERDDMGNENTSSSFSSRPRAVSDGPQHHEKINPLANNNWSFSNLPPTPKTESRFPQSTQDSLPNGNLTTNGAVASSSTSDSRREQASMSHGEVSPVGDSSDDEAVGEPDWAIDGADELNMPQEAAANAQAEAAAPARQPAGLVDRVADFMWGDVEVDEIDEVAAGPVDIFMDDQEAQFAEANHDDEDEVDDDNDTDEGQEDEGLAQDVVEAAEAAGIDAEALEDAEDFEGIMELIGMRGPILGLFQNALFCCFLVSITIFLGIFVPYNIGRLAVWIVANPGRLVQMVFSFSKFIQDIVLVAVSWTLTFAIQAINIMSGVLKIERGRELLLSMSSDARILATNSFNRVMESFMSEIPLITATEMRNFSALSHEALIHVKSQVHLLLSAVANGIEFVFGGDYGSKYDIAKTTVTTAAPDSWESLWNMTVNALQPNAWVISLNLPERVSTVDPALAYWSAKDRSFAILGGYISLSVMAGLYLGRGTPFSSSQTAQEWEASIIDALNQASGVMKVILIISIEMLVFPLYCGMLLDFALLPLFEATTLKSRLLFTYNFPLTSIFVHWFVGTGYMFHFALFVSMCRKIMRRGVLYFIRDPDDPEFHPVRDVLERNVTTQLRKILFSAFVYGALVIVCLGGVVWGLSLALPHVLPIHYSSNEPVLEFPIDLLFYNFLMPLAVKFFRPSDGLHGMYTWWFRRCARTLRLTWFLFGERRIDEEGTLSLAEGSQFQSAPWYRKLFLELDSNKEVTPKTWSDILDGAHAKPRATIHADEMKELQDAKERLVSGGQLIADGRFVKTPASDQVKIPKGQAVFQDVSERDISLQASDSATDPFVNLNNNFQFVYVPPWFRLRIFLFILFIWIFAAVTGVSFTIIPLVFGREMFRVLIPAHIRTNDIYAFSIGIYMLGSLSYFVFHARLMLDRLKEWVSKATGDVLDRDVLAKTWSGCKTAARLTYTYTMLLVVLPLLVTLLVELYVLMPLHTWMYPTENLVNLTTSRLAGSEGHGHTIRLVQAWTLGLLYIKLGSRALVLYGGRPSQAVRAVLRKGWLDPDVGVLTRAFVVPGVLVAAVLIFVPPAVAAFAMRQATGTMTGIQESVGVERQIKIIAFRMSYPVAASALFGIYMSRRMVGVLEGWRARVRDEAYLMGERLHNFGGLVTAGTVKNAGGSRGEWRQGARL